jgi:predicted ATP-grasp superfamily ATP-dependent carboligase
MTRRPLRILLTEGSSLSARQTLFALRPGRHHIELCDPNPLFCLARYSCHVRACHRCPSFTADPAGYLNFLLDRLDQARYDVLLPVHDQVYLVSRCRDVLAGRVGVPVPEFAALEKLQSKAEMVRLLDELDVPYPPTRLVRTRRELEELCDFPGYVKLPFSTAGRGVWLVRDVHDLARLADDLERAGHLSGRSEVLLQRPMEGTLGVVQSVFRRGRLVAGHTYLARGQGVGGSAWARIGVRQPVVLEHVARIGAHLDWHGALSFDYIWDAQTGQPAFIDANPRIGETFNATLSGVNLCEALLDVALDRESVATQPVPGVQTHTWVMRLLALAETGTTRRRLVGEMIRAWRGRGEYAASEDELTRPGEDLLSLLPAMYLVGRLLLSPRAAAATINRAVERYALTEAAAANIRDLVSSERETRKSDTT